MKKQIKIFIFLLSSTFSFNVLSDIANLQKGIGLNDLNIYQIAPTSIEYARARHSHINSNDEGVSAFLRAENTSNLYSLSRSLNLYHTNFDTRTLINHWPITRWPYLFPPEEITKNLNNFSIKNFKSRSFYRDNYKSPGCLTQYPLRYGDIETDNQSEIVLFLNGEMIIFSPQYQRVVFANFWEADDWERTTGEFNSKPSTESAEVYQFASDALALRDIPYKAMRSYSKVYAGDFDQDNHSDILVWQKVYESNTIQEAPGFKLLRSSLKHYERNLTFQATTPEGITGEYLPQVTEPTVIQVWLTSNNLTWQKGYPSVSECAGQEGQLIPEMHDPLLNDPEVLQ